MNYKKRTYKKRMYKKLNYKKRTDPLIFLSLTYQGKFAFAGLTLKRMCNKNKFLGKLHNNIPTCYLKILLASFSKNLGPHCITPSRKRNLCNTFLDCLLGA